MRNDPLDFIDSLSRAEKEPRFVVTIQYPTNSPHFTSRSGISNVPGVPVYGVLKEISGSSQELFPEQGRATIGSHSFSVVDVSGNVTSELRSQLTSNDAGPRRREVQCFMGFTDDFNDYRRIWTEQLDDVQLVENVYRFRCADIQRTMRDSVFDPKKTRLTAALTDSATTLTVDDTTDFSTVAHTAAFSDAPSSTVGYIRVKKTGEIIRYTGKTATTFTGCTRAVFNTVAQAVAVDTSAQLDQKPEIEEFIYLEMPGPELAYAVLTGVIRSSAASPQDTLPSHWHLGISEALVAGTQFDNIGLDLVDPATATAGLVFRFTHLERWDAKQFLEQQIMLPMGCYMPIDVFGIVGLKRFSRILTNAAQVVDLDETNIVSVSGLHHDQGAVVNQIQIDWNYNGEQFTRRTFSQDQASLSRNQDATVRSFKFYGISISRHSDETINRIVRTLADRYGEPPIRCDTRVLPSLSGLEVGDVVRQTLTRFRDYQDTATLDRAFEIQGTQIDFRTGEVVLKLFGTGREVASTVPAGSANALPDNWYTSTGTILSTPLTISTNQVTANGSLTGNADLNNTGAIFYWDNDLTINAGVTVTISANVQLRIKGTLTVNGKIDGLGNGLTGTTSPNTVSSAPEEDTTLYAGVGGFFGSTRGGDGFNYESTFDLYSRRQIGAGGTAIGIHNAVPVLDVSVSGAYTSPPAATLSGLPSDLRGSSGGAGVAAENPAGTVVLDGGDGGDGGAGLAIICRGLAFGASGEIDLSGADGTAGDNGTVGGRSLYGGSGAGGAPGALYVLLDGEGITFPDLGGKFVANRGATPTPGTLATLEFGWRLTWSSLPGMGPVQGFPGNNHADVAHQIQYIPIEAGTGDGEDETFAPSGLTVTPTPNSLELAWTNPPLTSGWRVTEIWRSDTNNRSNATLRKVTASDDFVDFNVDVNEDYYYWVRGVHEDGRVSDWHPLGSTSGVGDVPLTMGEQILWDPTFDRTDAAGGNTDEPYWTDVLTPTWIDNGGEGGSTNAVESGKTSGTADGWVRTTRKFKLTSRLLHVTVRYRVESWSDGGTPPDPTLKISGTIRRFLMQKGGKLASGGADISGSYTVPDSVRDESPFVWHTARFTIDMGADFDSDAFDLCDFSLSAGEVTEITTNNSVTIRFTSVFLVGAEGFAAGVSGAVVAPATQTGKLLDDNGDFIDVTASSGWPATVSQAEAEAGTVTALRSWTPERVKQAIEALGLVPVGAIKTADESDQTTTVQDDDHITGITLAADTRYLIEGYIEADNPTASIGDAKIVLTFSQTPADVGSWGWLRTDWAGNLAGDNFNDVTAELQLDLASSSAVTNVFFIKGWVHTNASNGGTVKLQWSKLANGGSNPVFFREGTWFKFTPAPSP